jgi:hypothetical protein
MNVIRQGVNQGKWEKKKKKKKTLGKGTKKKCLGLFLSQLDPISSIYFILSNFPTCISFNGRALGYNER